MTVFKYNYPYKCNKHAYGSYTCMYKHNYVCTLYSFIQISKELNFFADETRTVENTYNYATLCIHTLLCIYIATYSVVFCCFYSTNKHN